MSNGQNQHVSPFLKAKNYLSFLRCVLGFPLTPVNEAYESFEFKTCCELIRYLIFMGILAAAGTTTGVVYSKGGETGNPVFAFNERLRNFGFTGLDVAVIMALPFFNIASNTVHFFSFKAIVSKINKITSLILELNENLCKLLGRNVFDSLEDMEKTKGLKQYWHLFYISAAPLLATILITTAFATIAFRDDTIEFSTLEKIGFCIAAGVFALSYIHPPSAAASDFIVYYLLVEAKKMCGKYCNAMILHGNSGSLRTGLQGSNNGIVFRKPSSNTLTRHNKVIDVGTSPANLQNALENDSKEVRLYNVDKEGNIISVGMNLIKVIKKMDTALAPMIANTYFTCMLVATGELYLASSVFFYKGKYEVTLLSVAGLSIAWLAIFRVSQITKHGHLLSKLMKKCSYRLDRFPFKDSNNLKSSLFQLLREEFQNNCEEPIAPFSAFTLSFSSLLGFFGSIVTYIIVLLQFRTS